MFKKLYQKLKNTFLKRKDIGMKITYEYVCPEEYKKQCKGTEELDVIRPLKKQTYSFILTVVILGALIPYAVQFIIPLFYTAEEVNISGVVLWNQFVSIVLGIVATIMSIVSLVLGFYSLEESNKTERRTRDLLIALEDKIEVITQTQKEMKDDIKTIASGKGAYNTPKESVSANIHQITASPKDETIN